MKVSMRTLTLCAAGVVRFLAVRLRDEGLRQEARRCRVDCRRPPRSTRSGPLASRATRPTRPRSRRCARICRASAPSSARRSPRSSQGLQFAFPVHFAFNDANVRTEDSAALDRFANVVSKHYTGAKVTVEGFADPAGSTRYNVALSQRRAEAVKAYVSSKGLDASLINAVGYGETRQVEGRVGRPAGRGAQPPRRVRHRDARQRGRDQGDGVDRDSNPDPLRRGRTSGRHRPSLRRRGSAACGAAPLACRSPRSTRRLVSTPRRARASPRPPRASCDRGRARTRCAPRGSARFSSSWPSPRHQALQRGRPWAPPAALRVLLVEHDDHRDRTRRAGQVRIHDVEVLVAGEHAKLEVRATARPASRRPAQC